MTTIRSLITLRRHYVGMLRAAYRAEKQGLPLPRSAGHNQHLRLEYIRTTNEIEAASDEIIELDEASGLAYRKIMAGIFYDG